MSWSPECSSGLHAGKRCGCDGFLSAAGGECRCHCHPAVPVHREELHVYRTGDEYRRLTNGRSKVVA